MPTIYGIHYSSRRPVSIVVESDTIIEVQELENDQETAEPTTELPWLIPGLCDLQVNGAAGQEFGASDMDTSHFVEMCQAVAKMGVSRFLPTLTTQSHGLLADSLKTMTVALEETPELEPLVVGFHMEGPFICPIDGPRGAHPKEYCREPKWDEFALLQDDARGRIRLLTLSPDYENSDKFIRRVVDSGVRVAIGHTAATTEQIAAAVDAGATLSTHLGNGAHAKIRRHPNYIWDQLAEDRLWASLIADGQHLPDNVLRAFTRCKTLDRILLISDITGLAGSSPGTYESHTLGSIDVLPDGRLMSSGQRELLAGASRPLLSGVLKMVEALELSLEQAVALATHQPAKYLGIESQDLQAGGKANILELTPPRRRQHSWHVQRIWWRGTPLKPSLLLS